MADGPIVVLGAGMQPVLHNPGPAVDVFVASLRADLQRDGAEGLLSEETARRAQERLQEHDEQLKAAHFKERELRDHVEIDAFKVHDVLKEFGYDARQLNEHPENLDTQSARLLYPTLDGALERELVWNSQVLDDKQVALDTARDLIDFRRSAQDADQDEIAAHTEKLNTLQAELDAARQAAQARFEGAHETLVQQVHAPEWALELDVRMAAFSGGQDAGSAIVSADHDVQGSVFEAQQADDAVHAMPEGTTHGDAADVPVSYDTAVDVSHTMPHTADGSETTA